jgi:hypothetical protein
MSPLCKKHEARPRHGMARSGTDNARCRRGLPVERGNGVGTAGSLATRCGHGSVATNSTRAVTPMMKNRVFTPERCATILARFEFSLTVPCIGTSYKHRATERANGATAPCQQLARHGRSTRCTVPNQTRPNQTCATKHANAPATLCCDCASLCFRGVKQSDHRNQF